MADSGKTNEPGAAAAEPSNGDQQVRSTVTQNDTSPITTQRRTVNSFDA